jgi:DNA-binding LacI/PurR family transcriptional regulator
MSELQAKQATLRDVADLAGVSYQTVWRVVKEHPHVAEDTRQRVLRAVRELDYRPHRAAQMLTTGRSYMLQLVIFEGGYGDPLPAMLHWTQEYGYTVVVTEVRDATSCESLRAALRETAHMVDGLLMVLPYAHWAYEELSELCQGRPFVVACTRLGSRMPSVVYDQWNGMRHAVEHLIGLGHRSIAEISGPMDSVDASLRHTSWQRCLEIHGLEPGPSVEGDWEVRSGYSGAQRLLSAGRRFTALVVGNDYMALGALRALREAGLGVPEDVSVVGFDDIPEAAYFDPPLTTVRQDFDVLGRESVEYLVSLIEGASSTVQQRVFYPELIVRQSTGRAGTEAYP